MVFNSRANILSLSIVSNKQKRRQVQITFYFYKFLTHADALIKG